MSQPNLLCVIDTETTGLTDDPHAAVIEVAATIWDLSRGEEVRCWSTLVKPPSWGEDGRRIAMEVCGIDPELVDAHGEEPTFALMRLLDFTKHLPLHAWNRPFDEEMIRRMDPMERRLSREGLWGPCLMREFSSVSRGNPDLRSKLTLAYEQCGFAMHEDAHRALVDARMSARCIHHIRSGGALGRPKGPTSYPKPQPIAAHENAGKRKWTPGGFVDAAGGAA
jgi:DNA polymerase III alpha subunit (gram-positive type)